MCPTCLRASTCSHCRACGPGQGQATGKTVKIPQLHTMEISYISPKPAGSGDDSRDNRRCSRCRVRGSSDNWCTCSTCSRCRARGPTTLVAHVAPVATMAAACYDIVCCFEGITALLRRVERRGSQPTCPCQKRVLVASPYADRNTPDASAAKAQLMVRDVTRTVGQRLQRCRVIEERGRCVRVSARGGGAR